MGTGLPSVCPGGRPPLGNRTGGRLAPHHKPRPIHGSNPPFNALTGLWLELFPAALAAGTATCVGRRWGPVACARKYRAPGGPTSFPVWASAIVPTSRYVLPIGRRGTCRFGGERGMTKLPWIQPLPSLFHCQTSSVPPVCPFCGISAREPLAKGNPETIRWMVHQGVWCHKRCVRTKLSSQNVCLRRGGHGKGRGALVTAGLHSHNKHGPHGSLGACQCPVGAYMKPMGAIGRHLCT